MSLGDDLWRNVLSFIAPWQLHAPPFPVRNVSADAQESFQVLEQHELGTSHGARTTCASRVERVQLFKRLCLN